MTLSVYKALKVIVWTVIINVTLSLLILYIANLLGVKTEHKGMIFDSLVEEIILALILAPFVETFIYQSLSYKIIHIPLDYFNLSRNQKNILFILLSSAIFAWAHANFFIVKILIMVGGVSLNTAYVYFKEHKFFPYLSVVAIHMLFNLSVTLLKRLEI